MNTIFREEKYNYKKKVEKTNHGKKDRKYNKSVISI